MRFFCDDLAEMHWGTIDLSVPLVDDVIQVGIGGDFATSVLRVTLDATAVTVRRLDGNAMQVHILRDDQESTERGVRHRITSANVFHEPVARLRLTRVLVGDGRQLWEAGGTAYANRHQNLKQFVHTIARFGLAKQRRMAGHLASA
jgi:hypothetical protein